MTGRPARPDPPAVVGMFDRIAPVYDLMNTLMTAGVDARWRRAATAAAQLRPGMRFLDVATGTGKLARAAAARVGPGGEVAGLDASTAMIERAGRFRPGPERAAVRWLVGDAMALPFEDGRFDVVTIGFGLRNLPDHGAALRELARVLAPGGRLVVLEIAEPAGGVSRLAYRTWFRRVVPLLGRLVGSAAAYAYLPESVERYPPPDGVAAMMGAAGLEEVRWRRLVTGMATLHLGRRPGAKTGDTPP